MEGSGARWRLRRLLEARLSHLQGQETRGCGGGQWVSGRGGGSWGEAGALQLGEVAEGVCVGDVVVGGVEGAQAGAGLDASQRRQVWGAQAHEETVREAFPSWRSLQEHALLLYTFRVRSAG